MLLTKWLLSLQGPGTPPATDGLLYVTGINTFGQIGNGNFIDQPYFQQIGTRSWNQVVVGSSHTLAIRSDGKLFSWGANDYGQLGNSEPYRLTLNQPYQIGNSSWSQVSAKENTSYGITSDGKLFAWGNSIEGQFGTDNLLYPGDTRPWNQLESGAQFTVGIADDRTLWTWGLGTGGLLGSNAAIARSAPTQVGSSSWAMATAGASHAAAIDLLGNLYAWGLGTSGRIGDGTVLSRSSPVQIGTGSWKYIATGDTHTIGIDSTNSLFAWGLNTSGQVGDGTTVSRSSPVQVTSISTPEDEVTYAEFKGAVYNSNWSIISSGNGNHFLGVKSNARLFTWGLNNAGQLGNADTDNQSKITAIGTRSYTQVSAGGSHSSAIDSSGFLYTWGLNTSGQLGDSSVVTSSSPVVIGFANSPGYYSGFFDGNGDFLSLATNPVLEFGTGNFTLELFVYPTRYNPSFNNTLLDFRPNSTNGAYPQLSIGVNGISYSANNTTILNYPTVPALDTWYHIAIVRNGTTVTMYLDGTSVATNTHTTNLTAGQLLIGANAFRSAVPATYHYGYINNLRIVKGTAVYTSNFAVPTSPLTAITNTSLLTCQDAAFVDNSVNALSISLNGNVKTDSFNPLGDVGSTTTWKKTSSGGAFSLGIQNNNKLYAWGSGTGGVLGDNTAVAKSSPVQLGNNSWALISAGLSHALATTSTGQLFAWGLNTNGKLGIGNTINRSTPIQITSLQSQADEASYAAKVGYTESLSWSQISAGDSFYVAIRSDAKLFTWGDNTNGQLGLGNTTDVYLPTKVGNSSWTMVSTGANHVLGISNNRLFAWGLNTSGQLGDYSTASKSSPTQIGLPTTGTGYNSVFLNGSTTYLRADTALDALSATSAPFTIEFWFYDTRPNATSQALLGINRTSDSQNTMCIFTYGPGAVQIVYNNTELVNTSGLYSQNTWNHVALVYTGTVFRAYINGVLAGERTQVINTAPSACALAIGAEADSGLVYGDFTIGYISNFRVSDTVRYTDTFTPSTSPFTPDANTLFLTAQGTLTDETTNNNIVTVVGTPVVTDANPFGGASTTASWSQISAGTSYSAAITSLGRLYTWGLNTAGQLGNDSTGNYFAPLKIGNSSWTLVAAGTSHTIATDSNNTLFTWGLGTSGQLGSGTAVSYSSPVQTTTLLSAAAIDAYASIVGNTTPYKSWTVVSGGTENAAGIDLANKVFLWGRNDFGQLGFGFTSQFINVPKQLDNSSWAMIAPGNHTMAIKSNGTLWAWGLNSSGELGTGDTVSRSSPVQIGTSSWTMVSVGTNTLTSGGHTLAIRSDGALFTWGNNTLGKLGDGTTISKSSPIQIGTSSWSIVSAGVTHSAAITSDGILFSWGDGTLGQMGDATTVSKSSPVQVSGTASWILVSAGLDKTFGITTLNELYAWGLAAGGSLGLNNITNQTTPQRIGTGSWTSVSTGSANNAFGITVAGLLFAWGAGSLGRLWSNNVINRSSPIQIGTSSWSQISAGYIGSVGLLTNKLLYSGGQNIYGEQGRGTLVESTSSPSIVGAITDSWNVISAGNGHNLAIRSEGSMWAWGLGTNGQLGDNTLTSVSQPVQIGASSWTNVSAGNLFSAGVSNGNLFTWGINASYQMGDGTAVRKSSPVLVDSTGWTKVYAANTSSIGLKNNSMYVWGTTIAASGTNDVAIVNRIDPTYVPSINDSFAVINAGAEHSLAIRNDGLLFAWGLNTGGQLGLGNTISRSLMTQVGSSSFTMVTTTTSASAFLTVDKKLFTVGNNVSGELGQGDLIARSSPVQVGTSSWISIGATNSTVGAIDATNKLYVWGVGTTGELGTLRTNAVNNSPSFVKTINDSWTVVSGGTDTTYAIRDDGSLYAWGTNTAGQLGLDNTVSQSTPAKVGTSSWSFVKAGGTHALAYGSDKLLYSWGLNNVGQVGDGTLISRSSPVQISNINANGYWSTSFDGTGDYIDVPNDVSNQLSGSQYTIEMWIYPRATSAIEDGPRFFNKNGASVFGYLVYLGTNNRVSFRTDSTNMNAGTINATANQWSHVAVTNDGTTTRIFVNGQLSQSATGVVITNANEQGVLRIGARQFGGGFALDGLLSNVRLVKGTALYTANFTVPTSPLTVVSNTSLLTCNTVQFVDESTNNFTLTVTGDTAMVNDNPFNVSPPVGVSVTTMSAGLSHNMLIDSIGKLYAWGLGTSGQLGTGKIVNSRYIIPIIEGSWTSLGTNGTQSFAVREDKLAFATGTNTNGQLGLINPSPNAFGSTWLFSRSSLTQLGVTYFSNSPVQVGSSSWSQVSAGVKYVSAIRSDGMLFAWGTGSNYQLGTGDTTPRSSPVQISTMSWNQVSASTSHTLAINNQAILYGWGQPQQTNLLPRGDLPTSWASFSTRGHSFAIDNEGRLFVWGTNANGQLGTNDTVARSAPVQLGSDSWILAYAGTNASFLIRNDYKLFVMGDNTSGRLGTNNQTAYSSPVQVGTSSWVQVSSVGDASMARDSLSRLFAWGGNAGGVLGLNDQVNRSSPVQVGTSSWTQVSVSLSHAAAIRTDGGLFTWGLGTDGRLGSGNALSRSSPVQVGTSSWVQVSCGDAFTAARRLGGGLFTWGLGSSGQLWSNATASRSAPVQVGSIIWTNIMAGSTQLYGITGGGLFVGGLNTSGRLGDNTVANKSSPVQIATGINIGALPVNGRNVDNMLAADTSGFLYAWGVNTGGQNGDGSTITRSAPIQIGFTIPRKISTLSWSQISAGLSHSLGLTSTNLLYGWGNYAANTFTQLSWREISAGATSAGIRSDYKLFMWGLGTSGQIGDGTIISRSSPVQIGTSSWLVVSTGGTHTLAIRSDSTLWTWGAGANGRLGSNAVTNRSSPVQVGTGGQIYTTVKAGTAHSLGIRTNGSLWAWGLNTSGELGDNTTVARSSPVQLGTAFDWGDISAGNALSMALKTTGSLWMWGLGTSGEMGDDTAVSKSSPIQIGTSSWSQISAGTNHAAAITVNNKLFMWGSNIAGQLGDNTTVNKSSPVQIGTTDWFDVNAGASFTMALDITRTMYAWGLNSNGQLGDDSRTNRSSPVQLGAYSWSSVGATDNSLAIRNDGTLWAWGINTNGQLGQTDRVNRSSPVQVGTVINYIFEESKIGNSKVTQIGASSWSAVAAGNNYSYAINLSGALFAWGANDSQEIRGSLTNLGYSSIQINAGLNNAGFIQNQ